MSGWTTGAATVESVADLSCTDERSKGGSEPPGLQFWVLLILIFLYLPSTLFLACCYYRERR